MIFFIPVTPSVGANAKRAAGGPQNATRPLFRRVLRTERFRATPPHTPGRGLNRAQSRRFHPKDSLGSVPKDARPG
jgi:hypothetical protein